LAARDCRLLIFPGAFNMTTGPAHWELVTPWGQYGGGPLTPWKLLRARALDNQVFVAAVSPARSATAEYTAWGHSTLVGPWGDVRASTDHDPDLIVADADFEAVEAVRQQIPVLRQKRPDVY
jgi:omega-amidase